MNERDAAGAGTGALRLTRELAFALPALVVTACLMLPVALLFEVYAAPSATSGTPVSTWVGAALASLVALAILVRALRTRSLPAAVAISAVGVAAGLGAVAGARSLLILLEGREVGGLEGFGLVAFLGLALAVAGCAVSARAVTGERRRLVLAWVVALVVPFALGPLVSWLSEQAGNAGMDVIALFVLPFVGVITWWAAVLLGALVPGGTDGEG